MRSIKLGATFAVGICTTFFALGLAMAQPPADLASLARAAKGKFKSFAQQDLARAHERLHEAAAGLEQRLELAGPMGAGWRSYLGWDAFLAELGKPSPQLPLLEKVYTKLNSGHEGLNLVWFAKVRQTLQSYLTAVQAKADPKKTQESYERMIDGLAKRLGDAGKGYSSEEAVWVASAIRWLDDTGQAGQLVAAVRQQFQKPNGFAQVAEGLVGVGIERPIDETTPVEDCILGTDIHGTGHAVGQVTVDLVPNADFAVLDTHFMATVASQSVGYNGPAIINSTGSTSLHGVKRLYVDDEGIKAFAAVSDANTSSTITGIGSTKGRKIVEKIASRRSREKKPEAEAIASAHASQRVNDRMDRESEDNIAQANDRFAARFRDPLVERNLFPSELKFSTTDRWMLVRALEADGYHLGALSAPPAALENVDLAIRVHQSTLNNLADKALGGMIVRDETFQATLKDLLGRVPEQFKPDEQDQSWAIAFAPEVPITFDFLDNQFRITVRGRRFIRVSEEHPAMDVTALYNIVRQGHSIKAVRQGGLEIFPPGFDRAKGRFSTKQLAIRKLLERRFGKVLQPELGGKGIELPGNWKKAGRLMPVAMTSAGGWMTIGWKRPPQAPAPTKTAQR